MSAIAIANYLIIITYLEKISTKTLRKKFLLKKLTKIVFYDIIFIGDNMDTGCIYNIDITTNDNQVISVSSDNFNHFYIANIDDDGNEMNYVLSNPNTLYANFFMLRIVKDHNYDVAKIIDRLYRFHDIIKIGISFTNGKYQEFDIAKKREAKKWMFRKCL